MSYLETYTSTIIGNAGLVDTINRTSNEFVSKVTEHFDFSSQLDSLLLGNVQSGKTAQMLGVISLLADKGYKVFILLTTDNVDLQRQTFNRFVNSLPQFNVLDERDEVKFAQVKLQKPVVFVLKKNSSILKKWKNTLVNSNFCHGLPLVIVDDEADAASLNTLVNKNRVSTINKRLQEIKDTAVASVYIQVTATPQAILLQTVCSGWKPSFVTYFKPGNGYLGGNFFYTEPKSYCIRFTNDYELDSILSDGDIVCPTGLRDSIMSFLVVCAHKKIQGQYNCNFMIHPSTRTSIHDKFVNVVNEYLTLLQNSTDDDGFNYAIQTAWNDLKTSKPDIEPLEDIKNTVIDILNNTELFVVALNSKNTAIRDPKNPDSLKLNNGYNIIVGGNTLGRGITFPNLQIVYYCRTSKTPQADTYWQHSRIFGYDRDQGLLRLFMPPNIHKLFVNLNAANEIIIKQIIEGLDHLFVIYPEKISPTRKNVLDNASLCVINGGVDMFDSNPSGNNTTQIDQMLSNSIGINYSICDKAMAISLLSLLESSSPEDFNTKKYISCIESLSLKRPSIKIKLIVRTNRDIAKGTGTLLSPNDRDLGKSFNDDIVLTLYRVNGSIDKGWNGHPLWIPNIKFPDNMCFYDTLD